MTKKDKELLSKEKEKAISTNDKLSLGGRIAILEELLAFTKEKQDEQNSTPKFKVGDWVVFNNNHYSVYQIEKIENYEYTLRHILGSSMCLSFSHENMIRAWTIEDVKDGDVLDADGAPFIYKKHNKYCVYFYCGINLTDEFVEANGTDIWSNNDKVYPATKEQCALLFSKMREEGYEWNANKKELKKIEKNPAWSEEDEERIKQICEDLKCGLENFRSGKNVKGLHFEEIINSNIDWLKSLKPQSHWKPTDEQMDAFEHFVKSIGESGYASPYDNNTKLIYSLLNDLKKL